MLQCLLILCSWYNLSPMPAILKFLPYLAQSLHGWTMHRMSRLSMRPVRNGDSSVQQKCRKNNKKIIAVHICGIHEKSEIIIIQQDVARMLAGCENVVVFRWFSHIQMFLFVQLFVAYLLRVFFHHIVSLQSFGYTQAQYLSLVWLSLHFKASNSEVGLSTTAVSQCHVIISKHVTVMMCILLLYNALTSI